MNSVVADWKSLNRRHWPALVTFSEGSGPYSAYWGERCAPLSVKFALKGATTYSFGGRQVIVDPGSYLIINEGTPYTNWMNPVNEFLEGGVFINDEICSQVASSLRFSSDKLLAGTAPEYDSSPQFEQRLYPNDRLVTPILHSIIECLKSGGSESRIEEQMYLLAEALFRVQAGSRLEVEQLRLAKASTRAELYSRLSIARDFMLSNLQEKIGLGEIAAVCGFSPHHFLRMFRQMFGQTPYQYLIALRLERARAILTESTSTITEVSGQLGFESASSFSSLYKRRFGAAPAVDRKRK